jgi:hypothetical protein
MANPNQTIPSTAAPVINSFTPEKQSPSFSSIINEKYTIAAVPTGSATYTPAQVLGGFIQHTANGASTGTFPTSQALVSLIEGAEVGTGIRIIVENPGSNTLTIAAGTGGTLKAASGAIATLDIREFLLIVTAVGDVNGVGATYDLYSLGAASAE